MPAPAHRQKRQLAVRRASENRRQPVLCRLSGRRPSMLLRYHPSTINVFSVTCSRMMVIAWGTFVLPGAVEGDSDYGSALSVIVAAGAARVLIAHQGTVLLGGPTVGCGSSVSRETFTHVPRTAHVRLYAALAQSSLRPMTCGLQILRETPFPENADDPGPFPSKRLPDICDHRSVSAVRRMACFT